MCVRAKFHAVIEKTSGQADLLCVDLTYKHAFIHTIHIVIFWRMKMEMCKCHWIRMTASGTRCILPIVSTKEAFVLLLFLECRSSKNKNH